jgi:hypothetical protein
MSSIIPGGVKAALMDDDKLREAAIDVAYEFKMFHRASSRLDRRRSSPGSDGSEIQAPLVFASPPLGHNDSAASLPLPFPAPSPGNNASAGLTYSGAPFQQMPAIRSDLLDIEALLIHFRNLMEFFYTKKQKKDDLVLATHYTCEAPRGTPAWHDDFNQRCQNLLAHLTYDRTRRRSKNEHHWYDVLEKISYMESEITGFLNSLTPERRAWFK